MESSRNEKRDKVVDRSGGIEDAAPYVADGEGGDQHRKEEQRTEEAVEQRAFAERIGQAFRLTTFCTNIAMTEYAEPLIQMALIQIEALPVQPVKIGEAVPDDRRSVGGPVGERQRNVENERRHEEDADEQERGQREPEGGWDRNATVNSADAVHGRVSRSRDAGHSRPSGSDAVRSDYQPGNPWACAAATMLSWSWSTACCGVNWPTECSLVTCIRLEKPPATFWLIKVSRGPLS